MSRRLERPPLVATSLAVAAWAIGVGLSAIRALAAGHSLEDFRLFTGTGVLDKMPDVDDAFGAGVGALVVAVMGWRCVEGIAGWRYPGGVHSDLQVCVGRVPGCSSTCGAVCLRP